ncbi:Shwachman-Bodian-Diamond_protein-like protein [Hexamita inflata]|uniref:Shwachman-Bodian-Diamond protein-like protein n=1 Tax=Hexamita inflata TaxID=28002 RepID=A0AA86P101_9EUKA|nr:Shwachman-Bodian-Diamond protein-like protein [Hexamita inflata]
MSQKTQVVSFKLDKLTFEIICKQDAAFLFRENPMIGLDKVLASDQIFTDAKKGELASAADIQKLPQDPIKHIIMHGHVSLSTEERRKRVEAKLVEIIGYIHANYLDNLGKPIAHERVKAAIDQLKGLQVDPFAETKTQVDDILKKLEKASLLYVKSGGMECVITCKYDTLSKVQQIIKKCHCDVIGEDYGADIKLTITVSPGNIDNMVHDLEKECKGHFNFTLGGQNNNQPVEEETKGKKKGKK